MFDRFVCSLFIFCLREFSAEFEKMLGYLSLTVGGMSNLITYSTSASIFNFIVAYLTYMEHSKVSTWQGKSVIKNPNNSANNFFNCLYLILSSSTE